MKKYWIKDLTKKQCIHAPTQLIADRLFVKFNELGLKDIAGNSYLEVDHWHWFNRDTVYYPSDGSIASIDYSEMENDEILTIDQLKDFDDEK